jgi:CO/xanthine dehydrogenase FAD-binding subunit
MKQITEFHTPATVAEAVAILGEGGESTRVIAGGTDLMIKLKKGMLPPGIDALLSVHAIEGMRGARVEGDEIAVGAATTTSDLGSDPVVREHVPILAVVADRIASAQIRNVSTIGGNLVNASPAGDLINPLLLLDARLVLERAGGRREVEVEAFFTGPGETLLEPGELLVEARFATPARERVFRFEKAGTRPSMECSVVTVGVGWTPRQDTLSDVRVAFGSSAPVPLRGRETEAALEGKPLTPETVETAARVAHDEVRPISDVRGGEAYRRALAAEFVRRLLHAE